MFNVKQVALVFSIFVVQHIHAQKSYFQQRVDYTINVTLNDTAKTLEGFEKLEYYNNSPDTLKFIWFHLWPNAYKNDKTAFSEQLVNANQTDFYFSKEQEKGYINRLSFKVNDINADVQAHSKHIDIVKLVLPKPLPPGRSATITTPFHVKLPKNFSRGGYVGQTFQITQWYPKPAVYDSKGWHEMPYLDQGEFYSEFGKFDVTITLPANYIVAATGALQNKDELEKLKVLGKEKLEEQASNKLFESQLKLQAKKELKNFYEVMPKSSSQMKTLRYVQDSVHDFAWFASKLFLVQHDTIQLASKTVDAFTFFHPWEKDTWKQSVTYAKRGLRSYSNWIGEYPYNVVSVVSGEESATSGGMEYPMITLITTTDGGQELDATITHEIGHNWFYGLLASNEREHAWMDEGMNTYYQNRYEAEHYGSYMLNKQLGGGFFKNRTPDDELELLLRTAFRLYKDQPIDLPAEEYSFVNYGLIVYVKASVWMKKLEGYLGVNDFDKAMRAYYNEWRFKHPYPADFKAAVEKTTGKSIEKLFEQLYTTGPLTVPEKKSLKLTSVFNLKETNKYNYISVLPAIGYNKYDGGMIGTVIHNYQLPLNNFNFIFAPMLGTRSKDLDIFGRASFSKFTKRTWLEFSASIASFTADDFEHNGEKIYLKATRVTPSIKLTLYNEDLRSQEKWVFQARRFFLLEDELSFKTVGGVDVVKKVQSNTGINQFKITWKNKRRLYPFEFNLTTDQADNFLRTGFTGNYGFNYSDNKGMVNARVFAGKFFYLTSKTFVEQFETERYHLNMTGPRGYEDYTYSGYYLGRNEFEGWMSQQMMKRDGFFKVNTDLLSTKVGKTDDWLVALNLEADIPMKYNPLSVLPIKIPLKVFADIGTYSEAWRDNPATGKFLYDAGVQLPLFGSLVNVYMPVLYSKVYSNYYKSVVSKNRFLRSISFTLDIQRINLDRFSSILPL